MGEKKEEVLLLYGKKEISLRKKMFGEGGKMEEEIFSRAGKIVKKVFGGK